MKVLFSSLCVLLLALVQPVAGAPVDYASVRGEVVKAYAQQADGPRAGSSAKNQR